jgi:prepilin-type N-terminal cleavage/methylation domain-containing protein
MPRGSPRRGAAGFTLLELTVVICLVGIFAAVALDRLLRYQEIAEKAAMEATIGAMRSGEALQASARILHGGLSSVLALAEENPVDWLAAPPAGYRGALYDPGPADVPGGSWYFDLKNKELVYVPQRTRYLLPTVNGTPGIRYKVIVTIVGVNSRAAANSLSELDLRAVSNNVWTPEY